MEWPSREWAVATDKLFTLHNFQNSQHKFAKSLSSFDGGMRSAYNFQIGIYTVMLMTIIHIAQVYLVLFISNDK